AAAPTFFGNRVKRGVRPLRGADLERPARGGKPRHARRRDPHARGARRMSARPDIRDRLVPLAIGLGALVCVIMLVEALIRAGVINRFIVPMPSQIAASFERVILEEDIFARFRLTFFEAATAGAMITVVGILTGLLLY